MAIHDHTSQRLFVDADLATDQPVAATATQANYLLRVLRLADGDTLRIFNGRDGEWQAEIQDAGKRGCTLLPRHQTRPQADGPDVHYVFAPLKRARLDYMVQKVVELGAAQLMPVLTRHTVAERVNLERMRANVIEAAEQCGILRLPGVTEPQKLERMLAAWNPARRLVFCDERAAVTDPVAALNELGPGPLAVLIGPEGGFAADERALLLEQPFASAISLDSRSRFATRATRSTCRTASCWSRCAAAPARSSASWPSPRTSMHRAPRPDSRLSGSACSRCSGS